MNLNRNYLANEANMIDSLVKAISVTAEREHLVNQFSARLIEQVRERPDRLSALDRFLAEYDLADADGVVLMCVAESLARIPDTETADALIADKLSGPNWARHLGNEDLLINASTWGLMLTGKLLPMAQTSGSDLGQAFKRLLARLGEPVVRGAIGAAMRIISGQFVMGETIEAALKRAHRERADYETFSFDMLGEAALTQSDAERYFESYQAAIHAVGAELETANAANHAGISVKLSALHPRFDYAHADSTVPELLARLRELHRDATANNVALTIDAEESDRLEMTLNVFSKLVNSSSDTLPLLGIAVQAYQKRALDVIDFLVATAQDAHKRIAVRLVKGAYWDTEIKLAQMRGLIDFPVYTRKCNTDVSYLACARRLLQHSDIITPQFATHNARTVAWVLNEAAGQALEFQRLHGMGEALYKVVAREADVPFRCRVYAPVGDHETLLPYLVRRLLENGANSSFVHRIADPAIPLDALTVDPITLATARADRRHPMISRPRALYTGRLRAAGLNFADPIEREALRTAIQAVSSDERVARSIINGEEIAGAPVPVTCPTDPGKKLGSAEYADDTAITEALDVATASWPRWSARAANERAECLERAADIIEAEPVELLTLLVRETGRTIIDAHAEIEEAIDFLRYYALECRRLFSPSEPLPGPAGEDNRLNLTARGIAVTISPWNFPVAIFIGQIAAALAAGNSVIAKPAEQSSLVAAAASRILHQAGVPTDVLQLLIGNGAGIGKTLLDDSRVAVVAFTGSETVAKQIARQLAARTGPLIPLIAETGGINAMIVDSSALPEQVATDAIHSAFNSAGQRCSALRVLYLQRDIADKILTLIRGYMALMVIGDPGDYKTDIGPVIDNEAATKLRAYIESMRQEGKVEYAVNVPDDGHFVTPCVIRIDHIAELPGEVFGPVLHVRTFDIDELDAVCTEINGTGYGLTLGIQSRINSRIRRINEQIQVGNVYINRNMIGAVVESQPFGGTGLSGTGPKAGGPYYLPGFAREITTTENTAAIGGNATLISLTDA